MHLLKLIKRWLNVLFARFSRGPLEPGNPAERGSMDHAVRHTIGDILLADFLKERRIERRWRWARRILIGGGGLVLFAIYISFYVSSLGFNLLPRSDFVAVVRLHGPIMADSDASAAKIVPLLTKAFERPNAKAVVLAIDSPGGQPGEAERIADAVIHLRAKEHKPVVAVISNTGASAAYLIALATDRIVAGHYSLVGSIGAKIEAWDAHKLLDRVELNQRVYVSGKHKDMLNPFKASTAESDREAQHIVNEIAARFAGDLRASRGEKLHPEVNYFTGKVWVGDEALRLGLVDEIATLEDYARRTWNTKIVDMGPFAGPSFFPLARASANAFWHSLLDVDPFEIR